MRAKMLVAIIVMLGLTAVAAGQRSGNEGAVGAAAPGPRFPRNASEFDDLFRQVSNWGRWGKDDQLGSANLVTIAKRKQALTLAKDGSVVSLAHAPLTERAPDNASPFEHTMNPGFFMD